MPPTTTQIRHDLDGKYSVIYRTVRTATDPGWHHVRGTLGQCRATAALHGVRATLDTAPIPAIISEGVPTR